MCYIVLPEFLKIQSIAAKPGLVKLGINNKKKSVPTLKKKAKYDFICCTVVSVF